MSYQKSKKGFFQGLAIFLILSLGLILGVIVFVNFYRYHLNIHIKEMYEWEHLSHVLPVVLSSTYNNKPVSQFLGEYIAVGDSADVSEDVKNMPAVLKSKFDLILGSDTCYRFYVNDFEIKSDTWDENNCKKAETSQLATMKISLPYSEKAVKQINLVKKILLPTETTKESEVRRG